jgi:hypothetical protein
MIRSPRRYFAGWRATQIRNSFIGLFEPAHVHVLTMRALERASGAP